MNKPILIIKDRPYLPNELEIELGEIELTSKSEEVTGRWNKLERQKLWVTKFIINMKQMSFIFNKSF
jgi:hypothetical protein